MAEGTDAELLQAWQDGDERAGNELVRRRVGEVTRFFRNKVHNDADVSDLVSQTFLGILSSRDGFRGETSFRRFVFCVAHNVLCGYIRKKYKREREQLDFTQLCVNDLAPSSPSSIMMKQREAQAFVDALRQVSLDDQTVLELKYFEGLTGPEIAETLEMPEGTVRGRLARATERLRKVVEARLMVGPSPRSEVTSEQLDTWAVDVRVRLGRNRGPR